MASGAHLEWHAWNISSDQHWRLPLHHRCHKPSKAARNESSTLTQFQEQAPKWANLCNMLQLCNQRKRHWRHWCKKCKVLACVAHSIFSASNPRASETRLTFAGDAFSIQPSSGFQTPHIRIVDHSTGSWVIKSSSMTHKRQNCDMWPMWNEKNFQRLHMKRSSFGIEGAGRRRRLCILVFTPTLSTLQLRRENSRVFFTGLAKTALGTAFTQKSLEKCEATKKKNKLQLTELFAFPANSGSCIRWSWLIHHSALSLRVVVCRPYLEVRFPEASRNEWKHREMRKWEMQSYKSNENC